MNKLIMSILATALLVSCNIKKEEKGALPEMDIDVTADAGELPEYEVNWADVNVGTTTKTVKIPKVVIVMEEEEVEVPFINFNMPDGVADDLEERTIMVEAEVTDTAHEITIQNIYASGKKLYVVSKLTDTKTDIGDKKMRVSDQIVLDAPDMEIKYYVVGQKPDHMFNSKYTYVANMSDLEEDMKNYKVIYKK